MALKHCRIIFYCFLFVINSTFTQDNVEENIETTEIQSSDGEIVSDNSSTLVTLRKELVEIKCTPNCVCDHYRGLRRASCENKRLANLQDNIPRRAQMVVFTDNYLTTIGDQDFHDNELEGMKVLNLSNNHIGKIGIFAFEATPKIEILDLSHNALQYILPEWFWHFEVLQELYLNDNNLGGLKDEPLFSSLTLQILNLHHCQLPHFYSSAISELPALQELDISTNYLIQLDLALGNSTNLTFIKFDDNRINCADMEIILNHFNDKGIDHIDDCQIPIENEDVQDIENFSPEIQRKLNNGKFEKMVVADDQDETQQESSWIFHDIIQETSKIEVCDCRADEKHGFLLEIIEMSPILSVLLCVAAGFLLGLIVGCSCMVGTHKTNVVLRRGKNVKPIRRVSRSFSIIRSGSVQDREHLILDPAF